MDALDNSPHLPVAPPRALRSRRRSAKSNCAPRMWWSGRTRGNRKATQGDPRVYLAASAGYKTQTSEEPEANGVASFMFRRQLTIEWGHCDPAGIVFNSRFFEFFDTQHLDAVRGSARREAAGSRRRLRHHGHSAGRRARQFPQTRQVRRRRRDRLARERIPPLQLRRRAHASASAASLRSRAAKPGSGQRAARTTQKRSAPSPIPPEVIARFG